MPLTINQKYRLRQFAWIATLGVLAGFVFALIEDGWQAFPLLNGALAGLIIGLVVASLELFLFSGKLRRSSFLNLFGLRVIIYFLLALVVTFNIFMLSRALRYDISYAQVYQTEEFQSYLSNQYHLVLTFSLVLIAITVFALQMANKLGFNNLIGFITGKYRTPRKQKRILMFLGLEDIPGIGHQIGNLGLHKFINDFLHDIAIPVQVHGGKVVHYMEGEVVIYWKPRSGVYKANCLNTFFDILERLKKRHSYYLEQHNVVPIPKCAVHLGTVIRAEVGEIKSEISFFGDTVNTTSRMLGACMNQQLDMLISGELKNLIDHPPNLKIQDQGQLSFKGKEQTMRMYSVSKTENVIIS